MVLSADREWRRATVLWTPCGAGLGAAGALWLLGYTRAASYLLTALCGGVAGVFLERLSRGRFDLPWLLRHVLLPAALATVLTVPGHGHGTVAGN